MRLLAIIALAISTTVGCGDNTGAAPYDPDCGWCEPITCPGDLDVTYGQWQTCEDQTTFPGMCNLPPGQYGTHCVDPFTCARPHC